MRGDTLNFRSGNMCCMKGSLIQKGFHVFHVFNARELEMKMNLLSLSLLCLSVFEVL